MNRAQRDFVDPRLPSLRVTGQFLIRLREAGEERFDYRGYIVFLWIFGPFAEVESEEDVSPIVSDAFEYTRSWPEGARSISLDQGFDVRVGLEGSDDDRRPVEGGLERAGEVRQGALVLMKN